MNTKQRVRDWLEQADFNGNGCSHSYLTISLAVGCSETHAIRCVRELEKAGEVEVERAPRGSKRPNTYRVRDRNPRLRVPVLLRLAEVRMLRRQLCQSKENSRPSRDNPHGKDNRSNVLVNQRCGRESRNWIDSRRMEARNRFERSRGVPEPARALRVVGCPDCEQYRKALDALETDLQNAETSLRAERRQKNEARAQVRQLKSQKMRELKELPNIEVIQRLWEFWRQQVRPDARNMGARTIEAVRDRLADTVPESDEPAYSPRYVAEAIVGARQDRWARDHGRDTLVEICQSPESLERFHRSYERYRARRSFVVDGIRVREDGR